MANVFVYGTSMAADVLANRQTHSPNIFTVRSCSFTQIIIVE